MRIELDEDQIASIVLNHKFPNHNIRKMLPFAMVDVSTYPDGSFISIRVEINDKHVKDNEPGAGKQFPWS